jgi:hypothetical protein
MDSALAHIRDAVALDARGEVGAAIIAYETGTAAIVSAVCDPRAHFDDATKKMIWTKIGE